MRSDVSDELERVHAVRDIVNSGLTENIRNR